jgi:hypothetical protein
MLTESFELHTAAPDAPYLWEEQMRGCLLVVVACTDLDCDRHARSHHRTLDNLLDPLGLQQQVRTGALHRATVRSGLEREIDVRCGHLRLTNMHGVGLRQGRIL